MNNILLAVAVLGGSGAVFGLILAIASKAFEVKADPRIEPVTGALPGANCGGCGYSGCAGYARAIVEGGAPMNLCASAGHCGDYGRRGADGRAPGGAGQVPRRLSRAEKGTL